MQQSCAISNVDEHYLCEMTDLFDKLTHDDAFSKATENVSHDNQTCYVNVHRHESHQTAQVRQVSVVHVGRAVTSQKQTSCLEINFFELKEYLRIVLL